MLDVKKTPRRVVKMASVGCLVTLALVATLLITGHAAPQRRAPRGASRPQHADDRIFAEELRLDPESSSKSRSPSSQNLEFSSGVQDPAKPQKGGVPKKYTPKPPKDTSKTPVKSTPIPPPNPQVYLLPTENVKLVFPDDDETVMAANLRALDDQLGRPSDLHAIILESGEDADTFSRALHDFQERTYNSKKVTETHDPTFQQDMLQGQFQYQAMLARQTKPSKRHHAKNHLQAMPSPLVYHQQPIMQADPFLLQQHPRQSVYGQHVDTYRGHRRRRSLLEFGDDVPVPFSGGKRVSKKIYPSGPRKIRSPDDESFEVHSDEKRKFSSDESDERPRAKPNAKPMKLSMSPNATSSSSTKDKSSLQVKSKNDSEAGAEKATPITEVALGTQSPGTVPASDQNLLAQLALDVSSSVETDDLLDYPGEINGISSESWSAEDDGITGTASPAVLMEADRDSGEISSEAPVSMESLEVFDSSEMSSESSSSAEESSERPDSSESSSSAEKSSQSSESSSSSEKSSLSSESSSSVEKSSESPESSEVSSESSDSVEKSSGSVESTDSSEKSSEAENSAEKSFESQESSESTDSAGMSSEAPESSELSSEDLDSSESSSESSSSFENSDEDPGSFETSSEYPDSSESPDSLEFFDSSELQNSLQLSSFAQQNAAKIAELLDNSGGILETLSSLEMSTELSSESFRSSEDSPEILINLQVSPDMIDESRKIFEVLNSLGKTKTPSLTTEKGPHFTSSFAVDSGFLDSNGNDELHSVTVSPTENSTDYYTTVLDSSELPFSSELFDAYDGSTDDPVVYSDGTEFFDSSENYVDSMETLQSSRFDKPKVLDDAVKNSMNGKKDFNMTEQYPPGASSVSSGSDGQFEVEDLTGENGKDQDMEMTGNEDSNFRKNFAKSLDATGLPKLPGEKDGRKSAATREHGRGESLHSSLYGASDPGTEEFEQELFSKTGDDLSFEATGGG